MFPPRVWWLNLGQVEDSQPSLSSFKAILLASITMGTSSKSGPVDVTRDCPQQSRICNHSILGPPHCSRFIPASASSLFRLLTAWCVHVWLREEPSVHCLLSVHPPCWKILLGAASRQLRVHCQNLTPKPSVCPDRSTELEDIAVWGCDIYRLASCVNSVSLDTDLWLSPLPYQGPGSNLASIIFHSSSVHTNTEDSVSNREILLFLPFHFLLSLSSSFPSFCLFLVLNFY